MATSKIDLFFLTPAGFEGHLEIALEPGEKGAISMLLQADRQLKEAGCTARPSKFGGSGKGKEPIPTACPVCNAQIQQKDWTSKDQKQFTIHFCPTSDQHFKQFRPKAS